VKSYYVMSIIVIYEYDMKNGGKHDRNMLGLSSDGLQLSGDSRNECSLAEKNGSKRFKGFFPSSV
jgi:hypothetical protein